MSTINWSLEYLALVLFPFLSQANILFKCMLVRSLPWEWGLYLPFFMLFGLLYEHNEKMLLFYHHELLNNQWYRSTTLNIVILCLLHYPCKCHQQDQKKFAFFMT